ncbi:MAG TPA: 5-deoxy-glucuronate isomerase, partial [Chitinophagaceae bacterium]|nr:5-deoxy-glucuronate isomerase [Chitinophagaceae bacterium]
MKVLHGIHPDDFIKYDTSKIREQFLLEDIVQQNRINLVYTHYDRMIIGGAMPIGSEINLGNYENLRADYFLERREMGVINVGGEGKITLEQEEFRLQKLDCLYISKGTKEVRFSSIDPKQPAVFYILSAPAHTEYPTTLSKNSDAESGEMGSLET